MPPPGASRRRPVRPSGSSAPLTLRQALAASGRQPGSVSGRAPAPFRPRRKCGGGDFRLLSVPLPARDPAGCWRRRRGGCCGLRCEVRAAGPGGRGRARPSRGRGRRSAGGESCPFFSAAGARPAAAQAPVRLAATSTTETRRECAGLATGARRDRAGGASGLGRQWRSKRRSLASSSVSLVSLPAALAGTPLSGPAVAWWLWQLLARTQAVRLPSGRFCATGPCRRVLASGRYGSDRSSVFLCQSSPTGSHLCLP